jgi:CRP-like cAMP-binding protein
VKAVIDTECITTNFDEFNDSIQTDPERAALFMKTLVRRLRQMNEKMASMDPAKRGLRERFHEWQKSMQPNENDPQAMIYWYMMY